MEKELTTVNDQNSTLHIHPNDNILIALQELKAGITIPFGQATIPLKSTVPSKHKFTIRDIPINGEIVMYGVTVGLANRDLSKGELITTENIRHGTDAYQIHNTTYQWQAPNIDKWKEKTFMGYKRANGKIGTRNYWIVIPMVFCENRNVDMMRQAMVETLGYGKPDRYKTFTDQLVQAYKTGGTTDILNSLSADTLHHNGTNRLFQNVDGIKFLTHSLGCGGTRQDAQTLCGLLAGYVTHPNVAGATVLSLGCQHAQVSILREEIKKRDPLFNKPLIVLEQQQAASEKKLMEMAITQTFTGLMQANQVKREPAPLAALCVGLECGGSDGFSGISANPVLGKVSDILVALKGSVILSEFPELCGVEQELTNRCASTDIAKRFTQLMEDYNNRSKAVGSGFDANPSPGNIRDGLITDAIKSAGAARKGGSSPVADVLDYPEPVTKPGLNLLCTPGNDVESTTAEVGSGANLVLFTTGLGTPTGNPIAPVMKISTNTPLFERMKDIIDLDTGTVITKTESLDEVAERMLEYMIKVASGEVLSKAEQLDQDDFIPWKRGVSL
ncbi:MAG: UxaA family hydrolase [Bacteroidota bacterium]